MACAIHALRASAANAHLRRLPADARAPCQHVMPCSTSMSRLRADGGQHGVDSKLSRFPTLTKPFEPTTRCPELVQSCSAHRTYISPVTIGAINHARWGMEFSQRDPLRAVRVVRTGVDRTMRIVRDRPRRVQSVRRGRPRQTHTSGGCLQMPYQQNAPSPKLRWMRLEPHTE